jgi:hypothetical protein
MEFLTPILNYLWIAAKEFMLVLFLGFMPYLFFAIIMQMITKFIRKRLASLLGEKLYIYLTCPGVMIHELSHALFCIIFGHKIQEMKLFSPENDGTLGYVNHSYNPKNPYQQIGNFFIGTGPIWGGVLLLYVASYFLLPEGILNLTNGLPETLKLFFNHLISPEFWTNWQSYLWLYIVLAVSSHITLSQPDIQGALLGSIFLISLIFLIELIVAWNNKINVEIVKTLENIFFTILPILLFSLFLTTIIAIIVTIIPNIFPKKSK